MRIADWVRHSSALPSTREQYQTAEGVCCFHSVPTEARAFLVASDYLKNPRKTLIIAATYDRALAWQARLAMLGVSPGEIHQLPSGNSTLFEDANPEHVALSDRLGALKALADDGPKIVIGTPQAALERTLPRDTFQESFVSLRTDAQGDILAVVEVLKRLGYEAQEPVRMPGGYSRRGGILDLWPSGYDQPLRIEWFDTLIESIRSFDPSTQRSTGMVPSLSLSPSREVLFTGHELELHDLLLQTMERETAGLEDEPAELLRELVSEDANHLASRTYFDRLELYRPMLFPDSECAVDFLASDDLLIIDEAMEIESIANRTEEDLAQALRARAERGEILASTALDFSLPFEHFANHSSTRLLTMMNDTPPIFSVDSTVDLGGASLEPYRGRAESLADSLSAWKKAGIQLIFATDQPNRAKTVLKQVEIFPSEDLESDGANGYLMNGNLGGGFLFNHEKVVVISDAELFGVARLRLPQRRAVEGAAVVSVLDLKPGDYVVHINFGIGIFKGLTRREVEGVEREFLYIEYQAPDKLFVPADQLDRIQKYLNPGDAQPKLNRLTGGEWQRTLGKAKEEARAFARDLVKLYAARKQVSRPSYGPDTPFQVEMEQTFPWVETASQLRAIQEAKSDLEAPFPMDRLICGDVGFGKTEVAIRVAFKAVQAGRQVAMLCPTTILSEQHYRNFVERLASFGTQIGLINRYTQSADRTEITNGLKNGKYEIVIGTHALLGKGIAFKQLGVVVIDEEQKFGVKQKEMLKHLRTEVDVLTLSATPIPRTLSMALMDIRQMSLINDPPPGRLPVRTFVRPYAGEVVREAILRELARGGQVFYVYNRVESIMHVFEKLKKLVPTARIGVGHGQMSEAEIEPIMVGFVKGEIEILLSTTIIESGIDISNANTLIVENANRLGLAQLYQLRGRVGRSDRQAYALFLYNRPMDMTLPEQNYSALSELGKKRKPTMSENAMARLRALQEFSTLGAGYSLAFRDLQIRGAGELLGAKQSGTMLQIGYELYSQLIHEAVASLKLGVDGDSVDDVRDPLADAGPLPLFEVPVIAMLPPHYIADQSQRLYFYQQLMSCRDSAALGELQVEIEDRYGKQPAAVSNAFSIMALRIKAKAMNITKVDGRESRILIVFKDLSLVPPRLSIMLSTRHRGSSISKDGLVCPFDGDPLLAIDALFASIDECFAELERHRSAFV